MAGETIKRIIVVEDNMGYETRWFNAAFGLACYDVALVYNTILEVNKGARWLGFVIICLGKHGTRPQILPPKEIYYLWREKF